MARSKLRKLWYLIADANGLSLDTGLTVGQALKIPNRVSNLHNDAQTNKPYSASAVIGDLTPNLPDPPPVFDTGGGGGGGGDDCGGMGQILMIVVAVVVAIYVGPAALELVAGEGVAIGAAGAGELFVAGAITGAASNLAGQVVGNVTGLQDGINFAGIAGAALGGGLTAGLTGSLPGVEGVNTSAPLGGVDFSSVARAAISNVVSQGANILVGAQREFSWASVAGAAVGAAVGNAISDSGNLDQQLRASGATGLDPKNLLAQAVGSFAGGATRQLLSGGRVNFASLAADAFGNTLGTAIAYGGVGNASQSENGLERAVEQVNGYASPVFEMPTQVSASASASTPQNIPQVDPHAYGSWDVPGQAGVPEFDYGPPVLPSSGYRAQRGDTISGLAGGSPAQIGAFARANGLSSSAIFDGRTYQMGADIQSGDALLGQAILNADNAAAALRSARPIPMPQAFATYATTADVGVGAGNDGRGFYTSEGGAAFGNPLLGRRADPALAAQSSGPTLDPADVFFRAPINLIPGLVSTSINGWIGILRGGEVGSVDLRPLNYNDATSGHVGEFAFGLVTPAAVAKSAALIGDAVSTTRAAAGAAEAMNAERAAYATRLRVEENLADSASARFASKFEIHTAKSDQARWGYGADEWGISGLKVGDHVYGGLPGQSSYYTSTSTVEASGGSRATLFQDLQVKPHSEFGYRPKIGEYEVVKDGNVPFGVARANPQFGRGQGEQFFISDYKKSLKLVREIPLRP